MTITYHRLTSKNYRHLLDADVFDYSVKPEQLQAFVDNPSHELVFAMYDKAVVGMVSGGCDPSS